MAKSALRLDTRRALQDGTYPVQIKVGYGTNLYLPTHIYLHVEDWDSRLQVCVGKQSRSVNNILRTLLTSVSNRILELRETGQWDNFTTPQLREMLTNMSLTSPTVGVPSLLDYINKVKSLKSGRTVASYDSVLRKLECYCDPCDVRFVDMSYAWYEGFIKLMEDEGLKRNTIAKYLKCLKTVARYASEDGIQVNQAYTRVNSRAEADTPMRNLPVEVFRRVRDTRIKGKTAVYLDAFMLSFYLIGINMEDLLHLPKDCIVNGRLQYKRAKTGKNYSILVQPEAQAIIDKYPGETYLLNFAEKVSCFRCNCNELLGKIEHGLTWYWARYSWANFAVELDIPKDTISEALGHNHGSAVTSIYIKYSLDKVDKANRMVIDYLNEK